MKKIKEEECTKIYQDNAQEIKALAVSVLRDMLDNGIPKADFSFSFGTNMDKPSFEKKTTYSKKTKLERKNEALNVAQQTSKERKKADAAYLEAVKDL